MSYRLPPLKSAAACLVCLALAGPAVHATEGTKPPAESAKPQPTPAKRNLPPPQERAHRITEKMKEKLNLTEAQVPKVEEINLRTAQQTDAASQSTGTREERVAKVRAVQQERDKGLKEVLNQDQWKKYQQIKSDLMQEVHNRTQARAHAQKPH